MTLSFFHILIIIVVSLVILAVIAGVVVLIIVLVRKNSGSTPTAPAQYAPTQAQFVPPQVQTAPTQAGELEKIASLRANRVINDEEFERLKAQIIGR